jgi:bifunctional UDP-N-acetylglucosamine pyrophosphorylase/glucosamine-1-phosphate N-acetyltransferase
MKKVAIILAAGKGVRLKSDLPKVSHMIFGKPMITRVLEAVKQIGLDQIFVIVGYKAEIVKQECDGFEVTFIEQKEQLGTGHAVMQARPFIKDSTILVLNGDVPLIKTETLKSLIVFHESQNASATILTASVKNPHSYGRIIRSKEGLILKIVEQKDATEEERAINEVNTGTYCFKSKDLLNALDKVKPDNSQKEYYLTDVIGILKSEKLPVFAYMAKDETEVLGVNTIEDLKQLEGHFKNGL